MKEIRRIRIFGNSYPCLEDGTIYPFHKSPGLLVYKDIANQDAPDTHINLWGLRQTSENEYTLVRLAKENSLVLFGSAGHGTPNQKGNYHLERQPSGLFVSKYEPKLESLGDLLEVDGQFGEPIEFSRVESRGGKRKWFLASEPESRYARRTRFVTPLYRPE